MIKSLNDWFPRPGSTALIGTIIRDGETVDIITSDVVGKINDNVVKTYSGSLYCLGAPHSETNINRQEYFDALPIVK